MTGMTKTSLRIKLPKDIAGLPEGDRDEIVDRLVYALSLPKMIDTLRGDEDEHDMWARSSDPLQGDAEDELYAVLNAWNVAMMADVVGALGIYEEWRSAHLHKSFEGEELLKAKGKKPTLKELIDASKAKRDKFLAYLQEMNPFSKAQMKKLDNLLKTKLPDYAKIAETFTIRAGFIAKARQEADSLHLEMTGALIDRFPQTIALAEKLDVVLTLKEFDRRSPEGTKMRVAPLTPRESRAVKIASHHAADKLTEISERHRAGVRQMILRAQKERWLPNKLASELHDMYGEQNRDWRRVAITELAFATNDAFLAGCEEGDRVVGMGSENACKYCKQYVIGKEFTVLNKPPSEDTYTTDMKHVWVGKSNYGRRVAEYVPCTPMHPNCRCRWHKVSKFYSVAPDGKLALKTTAQLIQEERLRLGMGLDPNLK